MDSNQCACCLKPKAKLECGLCHEVICKYCAKILPEDSFSFLVKVPDHLSHNVYCPSCFESKVATDFDDYNQTMDKAKNILVYFKNQGKETRLIRRLEDPVRVVDCLDHDEALLRLAFQAVKARYNGLVDVEIVSKKIKNGSYQTTQWSGSGVPAEISAGKLVKDRSIWHQPN